MEGMCLTRGYLVCNTLHMASKSSIPAADRQSSANYRHPVAEATLHEVIKAKLTYPLVSQRVLAQILDISEETVSRALTTPYAVSNLTHIKERGLDTLKAQVVETQYNSVQYYDASVNRGLKEIVQKNPLPHVLTNARACADSISGITGLLKTNVLQIQGKIDSPDEYAALTELEQDQDVSAYLSSEPTVEPEQPKP